MVVAHVTSFAVSEFFSMYYKEETYDSAYSMYEFGVTFCYDHVWLAALALNCTDSYLREIGMY